jgi:hypothetical protein
MRRIDLRGLTRMISRNDLVKLLIARNINRRNGLQAELQMFERKESLTTLSTNPFGSASILRVSPTTGQPSSPGMGLSASLHVGPISLLCTRPRLRAWTAPEKRRELAQQRADYLAPKGDNVIRPPAFKRSA